MAYPVRLEVASLAVEKGEKATPATVLPQTRTAVTDLPPVADTSNSPTRPVFVISDSVKRPKTTGIMGSGRVIAMTTAGTLYPSTNSTACYNPTPRSRSSPLIGRRCTRVMPLLPTTQLQAPANTRNTPDHGRKKVVQQGMSNVSHPLKIPKWNRELRRESQQSTVQDGSEVLWPRSSLDSGTLNHDSLMATTNASPNLAPTQGGYSPWIGRYTVPTINIASEHSSTRPLRSSASLSSSKSDFSTSLEHSRYVTERIHHLVSAFSQRANRVKAQITQPPTPSTELSDGGDDSHKAPDTRQRLDSLNHEISSRSQSLPQLVGVNTRRAWLLRHLYGCRKTLSFPQAMEPQSRLYISWLLVVCIVYVYNAWVIPLRSVFSEYQTSSNLVYWLTADYLADFVYILDIVVFKSRVMYLDNGFWVNTPKLMRRYYWKTSKFRYDLASLLPLDLLYFKFGLVSILRLPRLIKIHTFWEFFHRLDSVLSSPHAVRVIRTVMYMIFLIHLNTCAYYGFSKLEGIGSNKWVFQGVGNAYIRCFYFATKTATSIGKNPKPENEAEYLFMTCSWLMGVFVFALLIGQIRDIVATATRNQNEFRRVMDQTQAYLHRLNLPASLQERVRLWFTYTWQNQKTLNEMKCLESLPKKMRTDIAINVHIQILSKVQLFQDCDKALLRDLVLKLQPVLYLPGDYVCKKGEVGKEMYIVQAGQVLVMGGEQGDVVLATLGEGSVFGEISLLALAGGNRRTADVRSRGFSSLFVLSKADLQATIKDYPEAQEILKKKAKRLIKQNEAREKMELAADENIIIKSREATPKLLHTVLQVVRPDSYTASIIRRSSRTISRSTVDMTSMEAVSPVSAWPWTPSSMSLEVPIRNSRRSSMEVPCSSSRPLISSIPKTSLSESLPEEEEEFLVIERTDVEESGKNLPGSPASYCSQHSISLHCGSRSQTSQSNVSTHSSIHSSTSSLQPQPYLNKLSSNQADGSLSTKTNKATSQYDDCPSQPELERSMSEDEVSSGVMSGLSSQVSTSSLVRYSPATLARQSCVSSPECPSLLSFKQEPLVLCPSTVSFGTQESDTAVTDQRQSCPSKHSHQQRSRKMSEGSNGRISLLKQINKGSNKYRDLDANETNKPDTVISTPRDLLSPKNGRMAVTNETNSLKKRSVTTLRNGSIGEIPFKTNETQECRKNEANRSHCSKGNMNLRNSGNLKSRKYDNAKCSSSGSHRSSCSMPDDAKHSLAQKYQGEAVIKDCTHNLEISDNHTSRYIVSKLQETDNPRKRRKIANEQQATSTYSGTTHNSESGRSAHLEGRMKQKEAISNMNGCMHPPSIQDAVDLDSSRSVTPSLNKHSSCSFNTINSNEDFLIKYGLSSSVESGIIPDTAMSCFDSISTGGESYDLFLTELSKTLPTTGIQIPDAASPASTSLSSDPELQPPCDLTSSTPPSKISCSAVVHHECSSPPESSPFDAQESKL
ncbi:uncharacterized protein [Procambarus clarkii]|uniref:uncharacterized protein isoform X1 n=1 Tax=Procambarus clarkii TaxID=6728 RepID=UPI0037421D17